MGILSGRSIGARCSPKPAPIHVGDLIVVTLRAHCSTKYTLEKGSDSEHETDENESGSESNQEENEEEDETDEKNDEFVRTSSNDSNDEDEANIADKAEGDEDEKMDFTTSQLYDDVDIRLNKPISQVIEDAHVTLSIVSKKTEVSVTTSSYSSDLAAKFLNFLDIPHTDAEIVSPIDVHVHHEVPIFQFNNRVTALEKEVAELKNDDPLKTQVTALDHRASQESTASDFARGMVTESHNHVILAKESSQPQSSYEVAAMLTEFELKKILIDKMDKNKDEDPSAGSDRGLKKRKTSKDAESIKGPKPKESQSGSSKCDKSQSKSSGKSVQLEEPEFEVADSDIPQDQEENPGKDDEEPKGKAVSKWPAFRLLKGTRSNYTELEYDFEECYKALLEKLDWENPEGGDYSFDLTKPLPLVMSGNRQKVPVDYFFNNDLKYLQGGVSTMTYMTSITKIKAAQYDLLGIKDMVPNIWVPVKVAYDKQALWGISRWRDQHKSFY
ncbi:hypothetical protein Tco_1367900 [Tanacetum coccineum]